MARLAQQRDPAVTGALWMMGVSLLLFFLPAVNGLIGGGIGGYKAGSAKQALRAAVLPAVVVGVGLWLLLAVLGLPVIGSLTGTDLTLWIVLSSLSVLLGAIMGGVLAGPAAQRRLPA